MPCYVDILTEMGLKLEVENTELKKQLRSANNQLLGTKRGAATLRGIRDSLNEALEMERVSNNALAKEGYELRAEVETLKKEIEYLKQTAVGKLNTVIVKYADPQELRDARAKCTSLREEVTILEARVLDRDRLFANEKAKVKEILAILA